MSGVGWWVEQYAYFGLEMSPSLSVAAAGHSTSPFNISLSPSVSMTSVGTSTASLDMIATPSISFEGLSYSGVIALNLTPLIGMLGSPIVLADFNLALTPTLTFTAPVAVTYFGLTLSPTLAATAYVKQIPHPIPWTL